MALLEKELEIKSSTIPGSGKGLFTKITIPKGARIIEYKGRITTWKEVKDNWTNVYLYTVKHNYVIDASDAKKMLARYVNDARGLTKLKGVTNNSKFVNDGCRVYIVAIKNIAAGEEIFTAYGKEYWDVAKANLKLEKLEKKALP